VKAKSTDLYDTYPVDIICFFKITAPTIHLKYRANPHSSTESVQWKFRQLKCLNMMKTGQSAVGYKAIFNICGILAK
jgi:hypothetical protein